MGHSQIFAVNGSGEITPVACDVSGNLVVNASLALSGEALETTQLQVLSNVTTSTAHLSNIDAVLNSGVLSVDGSSVTQPISGSVSVSNFPATQAISAVSLPLPTGAASSTNQLIANSSLSNIDALLQTTLNTSDLNTHTRLDGLNSNISTLATQTTIASLDNKVTQGYDATVASGGSGLQQMLCYGRDNAGNLEALDVDASGHLKITLQDEEKDVSDATPWSSQSIPDGTSAETSSIDMTVHKHIVIMGSTTNTSDPIHIRYSNDNTNFYTSDNFIYPNWSSGNFGYTLNDTPVKYIKLQKENNSGSAETITLTISKMKF